MNNLDLKDNTKNADPCCAPTCCGEEKQSVSENSEIELKEIVKEKYAEIAKSNSAGCCGEKDYSVMQDDYSNLNGYEKDADMGLGCGLPTAHAGIEEGNTVVDLGCGAGNDIFVARSIVGDSGKLVGIDFTDEMLEKANKNKEKLNAENVDFLKGEIEDIPLENNFADVVISNCVFNLVPNKDKAFKETYRVLKPGGHFCISDIVIKGEMPNRIRRSAELYAGCVSGAIKQDEYLDIIKRNGFQNIEIKASKKIELPDELLQEYLREEVAENNNWGIYSITVVAYK